LLELSRRGIRGAEILSLASRAKRKVLEVRPSHELGARDREQTSEAEDVRRLLLVRSTRSRLNIVELEGLRPHACAI
jgi:hypothetical protein